MKRALQAELDGPVDWTRQADREDPAVVDDLMRPDFDLVVADASWSWTQRLFSPLADHGVRTLLLKASDWRNALHRRTPPREWLFPLERRGPNLWEQTCILPPGWMKSYPRLGMKPIAWSIRRWRRSLGSTRRLVLAVSYPHYLYLRDLVRPDALVYYNMDDYEFYWTSRRQAVRRLEHQTVREADLSLFCAKIRADELSGLIPESAPRIVHLPHGAPRDAIAPLPQARPAVPPEDIAHLPRPLLGYVGSLQDRIDWGLIARVASEFPGGSVVLVGREPEPCPRDGWYADYLRATALPNVHRLGWRTQAEIGQYNAAFDVCLIPYRADHPFNRVSCPTKVMDYMATSRPVVTTPIPECQLYDHLFHVADDADSYVAAVRRVVEQGSDDGRALLRWEAARASTWELTAAVLLKHLQAATARKA